MLEVSQCSAEVFRAVLAHIYTGQSAPSLADVWTLTAVAEFYMLHGLQVRLPPALQWVVNFRLVNWVCCAVESGRVRSCLEDEH